MKRPCHGNPFAAKGHAWCRICKQLHHPDQ